jgi:hypothetical protein
LAQGKNKHHPRRRRAGCLRFIQAAGVASSSFVRKVDSDPESTFSHNLARAKSDEGGYLATLADIDSTTLEQGNGSILASKPGSILASAEGPTQWEPDDATADKQTQAPETMEAIVAQFETAKSFHDTWRNRIFLTWGLVREQRTIKHV